MQRPTIPVRESVRGFFIDGVGRAADRVRHDAMRSPTDTLTRAAHVANVANATRCSMQ
ncbi:hypothetical protein BVI1335_270092 [Burkholderia vietnamiensis]|nr:hypothetical protein BVI1335_270092 [Burkholderia vietnamiensis]